ncbi:MAG: esterase/lipase family protein [Planctomycetota bacterium]|jgi:pimeloyl-ACP methyl ester carboxylesterase
MREKRIFLVLLFLALTGCSRPYSAKPLSALKIFEERDESVLDSDEPSQQTEQQLRLLFLDKRYKKEPLEVVSELYDKAYETGDSELMIAAAELALLHARETFKEDKAKSSALYVNAAELGYDYLFMGESDEIEVEHVLKPTYRFMADVYNRSVTRLIEIRSKHENPWPEKLSSKLGERSYETTIEKEGKFIWDPDTFDLMMPSNELRIKGLRNDLGATLVGIVRNPAEHPKLGSHLPPQGVTYPVTALLSFGERELLDGKPHRKVKLAFYDPMQTEQVSIEGHQIPLEADYSTPLGVMLAKMEGKGGGIAGMFKSDEYADFAGIYMLEPLSLEKIPVVMVHGLMSEPATWVEMFNDLRGRKEIRENYQFWFFKYPTGLPVPYSSSILRRDLLEIYSKYNPDGENPYFNNMVLLGHSMGGLLSRMMMQDSGTVIWDSIFTEPIDEIALDEEEKEPLREIAFFESLPFVKRTIFASTPHRGSDLADKWFTKIGAGLIHLPDAVTNIDEDIQNLGQDDLTTSARQFSKRSPNALDHLSPSSNFVKVTNKIPLRDGIPYHSIIGVRKSKTGPGSSDGIVPYWSSHMDITVSEVLVPSGHSSHRHPIAIAEVKRILLVHLETKESN